MELTLKKIHISVADFWFPTKLLCEHQVVKNLFMKSTTEQF